MKVEFEDKQLAALLQGERCRKYKRLAHDAFFIEKLNTLILHLKQSESMEDAKNAKRYAIENLKGNLAGYYSARIVYKRQERLIFTVDETRAEVIMKLIELSVDHYGTGN